MEITRRNALKIIGATPVAAGLGLGEAAAEQAAPPAGHAAHVVPAAHQAAARGPYTPKFFTPHEYATVTLLGDLILPRDDRSGSASDAGVPQFIDFTMTDRAYLQTPVRGGLRWLDHEAHRRFGKAFVDCAAADRTALLDDIAFQRKANPDLAAGAAFFATFRDLVATGFFTSRIGFEDLKYMGNVPNPNWNGCPPECLEHLGLKA
jgi:gluconate 2-dehydrogenase subunit 3-like protein